MKIGSDRCHLVGVGGAGMSALARLLHGIGTDLSGSDRDATPVTEALRACGIDIWTGSHPARIRGEGGYVVRSAAVMESDPEVRECVRRGFTSLLYAEAVGRLSEGKRTLAIAGTHGKTTTTAMTVAALRGAGFDPSHLVGGEVPQLGGNGYGGKDNLLVVEACEFNRSFHQLMPFAATILNLQHDHFDCYPSTDDLVEAFARYAAGVRPGGTLFVEESVPPSVVDAVSGDVRVLRVGSGLFAEVRAIEVSDREGRYAFTPVLDGKRLPRVELSVPGRFQIQNALSAIGMVLAIDGSAEGACAGISGFDGVRRRFETRCGPRGGILVNDYAHHPEEIRAVLRTARKRWPGQRILVAFQPHQHRRTLHLLEEFAASLADADFSLVADIYGAREEQSVRDAVCSNDVVEAVRALGGFCEAAGAVQDVPERLLAHRRNDDVVLVLGAGDIDGAVERLVEAI
jgi:UDP-N-acetylmuramate--alanine ligase